MTNKTGILISILILCSSFAIAEQIEAIGEPVALSKPGEYYLGPKWSPSGDQVAVGGPSYTGLYLLDFPKAAEHCYCWSHRHCCE